MNTSLVEDSLTDNIRAMSQQTLTKHVPSRIDCSANAPSVYLDRTEYLSCHSNLWLIYCCCVQSVYSKKSLAGILIKEDLSDTPSIFYVSSAVDSEERGK